VSIGSITTYSRRRALYLRISSISYYFYTSTTCLAIFPFEILVVVIFPRDNLRVLRSSYLVGLISYTSSLSSLELDLELDLDLLPIFSFALLFSA
jgi:hypothetical protein